MNKNLLKNPWILAGLHLLITVIIGLILVLLNDRLNLDIKVGGGLSAVLAALITGQIYVFKFRELINKKLRLKVSFIAVAIQFVGGILLGFFSNFTKNEWTVWLGILIMMSAIFFFGIYLMLGVGGKGFLKAIEKRKI